MLLTEQFFSLSGFHQKFCYRLICLFPKTCCGLLEGTLLHVPYIYMIHKNINLVPENTSSKKITRGKNLYNFQRPVYLHYEAFHSNLAIKSVVRCVRNRITTMYIHICSLILLTSSKRFLTAYVSTQKMIIFPIINMDVLR